LTRIFLEEKEEKKTKEYPYKKACPYLDFDSQSRVEEELASSADKEPKRTRAP